MGQRTITDTKSIKYRLKSALATPLLRKILRRPSIFELRDRLAEQYISGQGIEIGAFNAPQKLPSGATARYGDVAPVEPLAANYAHIGPLQTAEFITSIETLHGVDTTSVDFVIANHVIEHVENPLLAMTAISRVLKPSGIAFITLPDKRFTFDRNRAVTPLAHVIRDLEDGPDSSIEAHYDDWVRNVEGLEARSAAQRAAAMLADRQNIHFHVWDFDAMAEFFHHVADTPIYGLAIECGQENRTEGIWVLRRHKPNA